MIYQTDPQFEEVDHLEGCCVFASTHAILDLLGRLKDFTPENMLGWLKQAKSNDGHPEIIADDFLADPQGFADIVAGPGKIRYLDEVIPAGQQPASGQAFIDYLHNPDTGFHHFVRGWQPGGRCIYDPINYGGVGSNTARGKNTVIESKRGYELA